MKKFLALLLLAFAVVCSAQDNIKPEFQAFAGALVKLKKMEQGFHKFMLKVDAAPWAFQATGEVAAPAGDADVLINALFDGELYAVLAYVPNVAQGSDGKEYNVGLFDIMLYYEDEPTKIRNLKFKLLPPANDEWAQGIFKDAQESGSLLGQIWKGKYDRDIVKASANPIDKAQLKRMQNAQKPAEEFVEKKTGSAEKSSSKDRRSRMVSNDDDEKPVKKKKKKKKISSADDDDDDDDSGLSEKEKRRKKMLRR
ncbi:MAG: hypothetical protein HUK21_07430 [Fibrobacteraceae bacterium]|nr:hypothetical protein [Fibrobacteraceae bacterium]